MAKRGRKPGKTQISVRIEKHHMDLAYKHAAITGERITDVLERAIVKLVAEESDESTLARKARFLVLYTAPEEQEAVVRFLGYLRMPKESLGPGEFYREAALKTLERLSKQPEFDVAVQSYGPPKQEPQP